MPCKCSDWSGESGKIDSALGFLNHRTYIKMPTVKPFVFCPWCGRKLVKPRPKSTKPPTVKNNC